MTMVAVAISMGADDPLAELARLIGQTDPFAAQGRPGAQPPAAPAPAQSYQDDDYRQDDYQQDYAEQAPPPPGPPSWMRRANVQPQTAPPSLTIPFRKPGSSTASLFSPADCARART